MRLINDFLVGVLHVLVLLVKEVTELQEVQLGLLVLLVTLQHDGCAEGGGGTMNSSLRAAA